jgi:hypothetical protein
MQPQKILAAMGDGVRGQAVENMLAAHLRKPEKARLFQSALSKFEINGFFRFTPTWSWWAFFGGAFYFFYRKMYLYGVAALALDILATCVAPFTALLVAIGCAMSAKFLYCKKFLDDLGIAGYPDKPTEEVNNTLGLLGGYNNWAIIVYFGLFILKLIALGMFFAAIGIISNMR